MLAFAIAIVCLIIVVRDFQRHRISNIHTLILTTLLLLDPHSLDWRVSILAILLISGIFFIAQIGMGDIKVIVVLVATQGEIVISYEFFYLVMALLLATVAGKLIVTRSLKGSVAFAHVLLLPFALIYLAI